MYLIKEPWTDFSVTTYSPYHHIGGGSVTKSKIIDSIKATIGYDTGLNGGYGRNFENSWPNDNPFTTTSTISPITVEDKATPTQTAMLEVFQWLYSSTMKPIISTMSTLVASTTSGSMPEKDDWGNYIGTYRVDEPPHSPGLSTECQLSSSHFGSPL